jgi:hypothetical protein
VGALGLTPPEASGRSPSQAALERVQARALAERPGWLYYLGWACALAMLAWAWRGAEIRPLDLVRDSGNIATYARDFFPPDFRDWRIYVREMLVTLHIAVWGTLLAIVAAASALPGRVLWAGTGGLAGALGGGATISARTNDDTAGQDNAFTRGLVVHGVAGDFVVLVRHHDAAAGRHRLEACLLRLWDIRRGRAGLVGRSAALVENVQLLRFKDRIALAGDDATAEEGRFACIVDIELLGRHVDRLT